MGALEVRVRVLGVVEQELPDLLLVTAASRDRPHVLAGQGDDVLGLPARAAGVLHRVGECRQHALRVGGELVVELMRRLGGHDVTVL